MTKQITQIVLAIGIAMVILLMAFVLLAGPVPLAKAASCSVPGGKATIQAAVDDPNCDPIIVAAGPYNENIVITRSLTLQGAGASSTIINGGGAGVVISITNGAVVTVEGFTITGGDGSSNVYYADSGSLDSGGGGIFIREATAIIHDNLIENNVGSRVRTTTGLGGGILVINSTSPVRISNNIIRANVAQSVTLAASGPISGAAGGGIVIGDASSAVITGNQILSNVALRTNIPPQDAWGGGGGIAWWGDNITIEDNTIQGNIGNEAGGDGAGGGIALWGQVATVTANNVVAQNIAVVSGAHADGGGISAGGDLQTLILSGNWVMSNTAIVTANAPAATEDTWAGGGGLYVNGGRNLNDSVTLENNHFIDNTTVRTMTSNGTNYWANAEGGGLSVTNITTTLITGNEVQGNTTVENLSMTGNGSDWWGGRPAGGGIYLSDNDIVTLNGNTVQDNVTAQQQVVNSVNAGSEGGGIAIGNVGNTTLNNNTISGNTAVVIGSITSNTGRNYFASGGGITAGCWDRPDCVVSLTGNDILNNTTAYTITVSGTNANGDVEGGGLRVSNITTTVIINNEVRGNTAVENLFLSGGGGSDNWGGRPAGGGIYLSDNDTVTLNGNTVQDNVTAEQQVVNNVDSGSEGGGIAIANVDNTTLNNNTISGNTAVVTGSITSNAGRNYFASGGGIMIGCWDKPSCNLSFADNDVLNNTTAYTITVSGTNANGGANGGGIEVGGNVLSATLQNNTVSGNVAYQQAGPSDGCAGGGMDVNESTVTMSQNRFLDNRTSQSGWGAPGAVWVWQGSLTSINDIFARNPGGGAGVGTNGPPSNMTIINDTFYNNGWVGIEAFETSTVFVTNTIVYSHQEGLRENTLATIIEDYNLLSNTTNYAGGVTTGTHTLIDQDPLFENAAADNFYLIDGSPAIDAGTSVGAPSVDFEGDTRDALVDIGADEWRIGQGASGAIYLPVILKASP